MQKAFCHVSPLSLHTIVIVEPRRICHTTAKKLEASVHHLLNHPHNFRKPQFNPNSCSTISIMAKMRALVTQEGHKAAVQEIDVPTPAEGEILVKVNYVAQNPTDW